MGKMRAKDRMAGGKKSEKEPDEPSLEQGAGPASDADPTDDIEQLKKKFDAVIKKYGFGSDEKSGELADFLTGAGGEMSTDRFAERFGTTIEDANVFLAWISVGLKFKADVLDKQKEAASAAGIL